MAQTGVERHRAEDTRCNLRTDERASIRIDFAWLYYGRPVALIPRVGWGTTVITYR
jgi:hypothetical protein